MAISKLPPSGQKPGDATTSGKVEKKSAQAKQKTRTRRTIQRNGDILASSNVPTAPQAPANPAPVLAAPGLSGHATMKARISAQLNAALASYATATVEYPDRSSAMDGTMNNFSHSLDPA